MYELSIRQINGLIYNITLPCNDNNGCFIGFNFIFCLRIRNALFCVYMMTIIGFSANKYETFYPPTIMNKESSLAISQESFEIYKGIYFLTFSSETEKS